ncbi:MAG: tRNA epoxyqueuosine(34) reductase QueG [Hyphomicrobiaceae bacterium]|nr:tRNA epoxyqueuosine(34) reductase QueG [Hyphomicrobiaceae bacterium]MCC0008302.1 tRNA epoxyqueuosine(34) reductase QueG [Hyphomicrobiaceae bacterium]
MSAQAGFIAERLVRWADELGFDAVGITTPEAFRALPYDAPSALDRYIAAGHHGDMAWMELHRERRRDPGTLWPETRSIIVAAASYAPEADPLAILHEPHRAALSVYARGKDYHDILKSRLKQLARRIAAETDADVKVFVDTAPLMEKPLAAAAGIGWQGKHTNLVSRTHGSWLFLGAILTTALLPETRSRGDHCGSCTRCLDICPTRAFPAPYTLDARRCIAYLTIEHQGHIPREFREPIGNRVFGCDDCLAVCPWNKFAVASREARFGARPETDNPPLAELLTLDDAAFRTRFAGTPIKRTGRDRFMRNVLIAAGNTRDPALTSLIAQCLTDASPLVRAMAVWALARVAPADTLRAEANTQARYETDAQVRAEWDFELTCAQGLSDSKSAIG